MESGPATVEEIDYEGLNHDSLAINMLAGSLAGISEHAVMFPVDSIKVGRPDFKMSLKR
jgi:solute carrier family 25 iron transporter 28/37